MDMLSQLEVTMRPAGCSTSGPTRSSVSTAMTTLSVASLVLRLVNQGVSSLLAMMTSTAMYGTHYELSEQVFLRAMITECLAWASPKMVWQFAPARGTLFSRSGTKGAHVTSSQAASNTSAEKLKLLNQAVPTASGLPRNLKDSTCDKISAIGMYGHLDVLLISNDLNNGIDCPAKMLTKLSEPAKTKTFMKQRI